MFDQDVPADAAPASYGRDLWVGEERSLFMLVVDLCTETRPEPECLSTLLGLRPQRLSTSLFRLSDNELDVLRFALSVESPRQMLQAGAHDVVPPKRERTYLSAELRYCPECLRRGWHSALFQHAAVVSCPVHEVPLRIGCPGCDEPIRTDPRTVARALMTCDTCGELFTDVLSAAKRAEKLPPEPFLRYRTALLKKLPQDARHGDLLVTGDVRDRKAILNPHLQRFEVWSDDLPMPGRAWCTQVISFDRPPPQATAVETNTVERTIVEALQEIKQVLVEEGCFLEAPMGLLSVNGQGAKLDGISNVASAALWKVAHLYRAADYFDSGPRRARRLTQFGAPCLVSTEVWACTLRLEVMGLFVRAFLELRRLDYLIDVTWASRPPSGTFLPAWRLFENGKALFLETRAITDIERLRRLCGRYGRHALLEAPSDWNRLARRRLAYPPNDECLSIER